MNVQGTAVVGTDRHFAIAVVDGWTKADADEAVVARMKRMDDRVMVLAYFADGDLLIVI